MIKKNREKLLKNLSIFTVKFIDSFLLTLKKPLDKLFSGFLPNLNIFLPFSNILFPLFKIVLCTCSKWANCKSSGKHPIYSNWAKKATTSKEEIIAEFKKHPNDNIGFATGDNYFVLDIDHGGYESLKV